MLEYIDQIQLEWFFFSQQSGELPFNNVYCLHFFEAFDYEKQTNFNRMKTVKSGKSDS